MQKGHCLRSFFLLLRKIELPDVEKKSRGIALLHGFNLEKIFYALKRQNSDREDQSVGLDEQNLRISEQEETIIRKVAGYIPYSLRKHYSSSTSESAKVILKVIDTWNKSKITNDSVSLIEYTNDWVDRTNRGGLFTVTDNFYRLIVRVEIIARTVLNSGFLSQRHQETDYGEVGK